MGFKRKFDVFWDRLSRSTPLIGIVASLLFIPARLQREADEDASYRSLMKEMGADPQFPHDSVNREKEVIAGEILAHLLTLAIACAVWLFRPDFLIVFLGTWLLAFVADWIGGQVAGWNFDRRHPTTEEILVAENGSGSNEKKA
jgi:hypothetical protein